MNIERIDHFVLTVEDIERMFAFYNTVLGMEVVSFALNESRKALRFGRQKTNLHQAGREFEPKAGYPTAGSADFCLITTEPLTVIVSKLRDLGVLITAGPVERSGAIGPIESV